MNNKHIHNIPRRDLKFDLSDVQINNWHPQGTYVSQFFNAMSILFPDGERFFIHSVRHYQDDIKDSVLKSQIKGFIGQEAMHGREHEVYNQKLQDEGYPIDKITARLNKLLNLGKKWLSPAEQLRITISLEHFTAILANHLLSYEKQLEGAPEAMKNLWKWHAIEETEHKAVAYDVYQAAVGSKNPKKSYVLRNLSMIKTSFLFWLHVSTNFFSLIKKDKNLFNLKEYGKLIKFLYGKEGFLWVSKEEYFDYFKFNFHPWQHKNFHFVEKWIGENQKYAISHISKNESKMENINNSNLSKENLVLQAV